MDALKPNPFEAEFGMMSMDPMGGMLPSKSQPSAEEQYWQELCSLRHMVATVNLRAMVESRWQNASKKEVFSELKEVEKKILDAI